MSHEKSLSIAVEMESEINKEVRKTSFNLFARLMIVMPVGNPDLWKSAAPSGYTGGQARGNWFASTGTPIRAVEPKRRKGEAETEVRSVINLAKNIDYPTVILSNNMPYIQRLNDGWSTQAPKKFIEKEMDRVARKR